MRDLYHNLKVSQIIGPVVTTTTRTATVDRKGYDSLMFIFNVGASGDTLSGSIYWTLKLSHSDDNQTFTDVPASDLHNTSYQVIINDNTLDEKVSVFGYKGGKRYVKAVVGITGTHANGTPVAVSAVLGHAGDMPVA